MFQEDVIGSCYNSSSVIYRLLRASSWGPLLMNLGWFPFSGPLSFLNFAVNPSKTQTDLVIKSVSLLRIRDGDALLDLGCGRGDSSYLMRLLYPRCTVTGVDLLPRNIEIAQAVFETSAHLRYIVGDAMSLAFPECSFDRICCLEAAFHFSNRDQFLSEARRVLRPGGTAVVVDFAWKTAAGHQLRDDTRTMMVRNIWGWHDLLSLEEYKAAALRAGFEICRCLDWSKRVTAPLQKIFALVAWLGQRSWGRRLLHLHNPFLRTFDVNEWCKIDQAAQAHQFLLQHSRYVALLLRKSPGR